MFFLHRGVGRAQLSASLFHSDPGSQTAEQFSHAMDAARDHGRGKMMRAGDDVGNNFGILRIWDARLEDANDCRRSITDATQPYRLSQDRRILVKSGCPETVGEKHDAGSLGTVVLRPNEATEHGMKAHHLEIVASDDAALNGTRLTEADHGEVHGGEVAKGAHGFHGGTQVLYFGYGKRRVLVTDAGSALPDIDQPVLAAVHERLEQHSAH